MEARSLKEEIANSITHGIGLLLSLIGLLVLVRQASMYGDVWQTVSCSIYGATLVLLYAASTVYHAIQTPRVKHWLKVVDHCSIYLLIAGTYTPFTLVLLRGGWGWTLFGLVWGMAFFGILYKVFFVHRFKVLSTIVYVLMGWLAIIAIKPLIARLPAAGMIWLLAGGAAYTAGAVFYSLRKLPYAHTLFHLLVLGGSFCHYVAVMISVLPEKS